MKSPHTIERTTDEMIAQSNLTASQFLIWLGQTLHPDAPLYNMVYTFTIRGVIDPSNFQAAFQTLLDRSDALRTVIDVVDGIPRQRVRRNLSYLMPYLDLSVTRQEQRWFQNWLDARKVRVLDLKTCLFDTVLLKLADQRYVWYLNQHHLIADVLSFALVFQRMKEFYGLALAGRLDEAPPLYQFQDFINNQHAYRQSSSFEKAKIYWQEKLAEPFEPTSFYGQAPLPEAKPLSQRITQPLGRSRSEKLKKIAQEKDIRALTPDITLFHIFAALLAGFIYRASGKKRIVLGTPFHNRTTAAYKCTMGLFINIYPFQLDIDENDTFLSLVQKGMNVNFSTLRYAQFTPNHPSQGKIYDVVLNYLTASFTDFHGFQTENRWIHTGYSDSHHQVRFVVEDFADSGNFILHFDFNTDSFSLAQQKRAVEHFLNLLDAFLADYTQAINQVNLLTETEKSQFIEQINATRASYPSEETLVTLFENQVEQRPGAVALIDPRPGDKTPQQLTYDELNRQANQIAHYLGQFDLGSTGLVCLYLERSCNTIAAILGVLKAGGVYVPLDPIYPSARLALLLDDIAQASPKGKPIVITQPELADNLPRQAVHPVCLHNDQAKISRFPDTNPLVCKSAQDIAYVLYTSGSTGTPKGVCCHHQGVINLISDFERRQAIRPGDACSWWTSISFDVSVYEIFSALLYGGKLYIVPEKTRADRAGFIAWLNEHQIQNAYVPPLMVAQLADESKKPSFSLALKRLLVGVEPIPERLLATISRNVPGLRIINGYGPTETTICATLYNVAASHAPERNTPIGRAVQNMQIYLLDPNGQLVPLGVPGEIHIGGVGVSHGYLNRPDLTAERFITDPFNPQPEARLYKTGDIGRHLPDGNIQFIGRTDFQSKIRGFRIEPGEIEAILRLHPSVKETVVMVREDEQDDKRLVGYIVPSNDQTVDKQALRRYLSENLPPYMIPSDYVLLDALPLTPSDKIDRKALPEPGTHDTSSRPDHYIAPRSQAEQILAGIWADVFGLSRVSVEANFFELGGDSIINIQIMTRANQAGLNLGPSQLFEYQTIAELAAVAGQYDRMEAEQGPVTGQVPLTPIQHWFFKQEFAEPNHWNQNIVLCVPADVDLNALEQAIQILGRHHDTLRLSYERHHTGWQQLISEAETPMVLQYEDLSEQTETDYDQCIERVKAHLQSAPNLETGDMLRAVYFKLGDNRPGRLLLLIHHLAVDGVSWSILVQDLETAYQQLRQGQPVSLPAKTTSFKQWSTELTAFARSPKLQSESDFWQGTMQTPVTDLPVEFASAPQTSTYATSRTISAALDVGTTEALLQEVPSVYNTQVNDVLLTALVQTFSDWTGGNCFRVDLEGHGREDIMAHVDISRTVGWFTTIYPVVLALEPKLNPGAALKRIKEQLRQIPNHGIGYGLLRYLNQDANSQSLKELAADVLFNYLGQLERMTPNSTLFGLAQHLTGSFGPRNKRSHRLNVNAYVLQEQLHVDWVYSTEHYQADTVQTLADTYVYFIRAIVDHCASSEAGSYTPSDFPLADLNEDKLSKLADVIEAIDSE